MATKKTPQFPKRDPLVQFKTDLNDLSERIGGLEKFRDAADAHHEHLDRRITRLQAMMDDMMKLVKIHDPTADRCALLEYTKRVAYLEGRLDQVNSMHDRRTGEGTNKGRRSNDVFTFVTPVARDSWCEPMWIAGKEKS